MSRVQVLLRSIATVGLIISMFATVSLTGFAQTINPDTYPSIYTYDVNECYLASVSNGEDFGLGAAQTSVTVQNLSAEAGVAYLKVGKASGFAKGQFAALQPGASKTFTAAELGVPAGTTAAVAVMGYDMTSAQARTFTPRDGIAIGCVAKQAVAGKNLPGTTAADTSVSGYNATSGREVDFFDDLYLPIAQTNCGPGGCWNTIIRVANVGPFDNAAVTLRFFAADDGSGSLSTGFQVQRALNQGQVASINLSTLVPAGWVGSVHVLSDDSVVAIADRYKAGTDMWITNTASNAIAEKTLQLPSGPSAMPYVLYAPDVRLDFNGWNTGISVANTVAADNTVNIQYFGSDGNAPQAQTQRLSSQGMTYFYNPSSPPEDGCAQPVNQVVTCDFVGGAIILSQAPVAVAVDGVKYVGNDANVGQAFSYSATGNVFQYQAAPLVQKGSPATGMGATSGITFLNVNPSGTYVTTTWINPSGFVGSNFGPSVVWVPGFATGFVYTMTQSNLPNGFTGSAVVSADLPIAGTTTNVDYAVNGDGTAIWNLYNPCGHYRAIGDCVYTPDGPPPATKRFDVRPLGSEAWVCVFDATDGQSGGGNKGDYAGGDCMPRQVFEKGASDGGQGGTTSFVARGPWSLLEFPPSGGLADATVSPISDPVFSPVMIEVDYSNNTITHSELPTGELVLLATWVLYDAVAKEVVGSLDANLTCAEMANLALPTGVGPYLGLLTPIPATGQVSGADLARFGDLNNAVVLIASEAHFQSMYCADLEEGRLRPETPKEMQERLGTVVPPFQVDGNGLAAVELDAGCYYFVVSAEDYETDWHRECLVASEQRTNRFDLQPIEMGQLTVWLERTDDVTRDPPPVRYRPFRVYLAADTDVYLNAQNGGPEWGGSTATYCGGPLVAMGMTLLDGKMTITVPANRTYCVIADPDENGKNSNVSVKVLPGATALAWIVEWLRPLRE